MGTFFRDRQLRALILKDIILQINGEEIERGRRTIEAKKRSTKLGLMPFSQVNMPCAKPCLSYCCL